MTQSFTWPLTQEQREGHGVRMRCEVSARLTAIVHIWDKNSLNHTGCVSLSKGGGVTQQQLEGHGIGMGCKVYKRFTPILQEVDATGVQFLSSEALALLRKSELGLRVCHQVVQRDQAGIDERHHLLHRDCQIGGQPGGPDIWARVRPAVFPPFSCLQTSSIQLP
jgi:hypothetical protein